MVFLFLGSKYLLHLVIEPHRSRGICRCVAQFFFTKKFSKIVLKFTPLKPQSEKPHGIEDQVFQGENQVVLNLANYLFFSFSCPFLMFFLLLLCWNRGYFTVVADGCVRYTMTSMNVVVPVMYLH